MNKHTHLHTERRILRIIAKYRNDERMLLMDMCCAHVLQLRILMICRQLSIR
jgi:hypothetical protein